MGAGTASSIRGWRAIFMTLIEQRERTRQIKEEKSKFPSTTYPTCFRNETGCAEE